MKNRSKQLPRQVRIIGGDWKRTPLPVPEIEGLRPTPDRVRETVFNWLEHLKPANWSQLSCLDLFAGSGALGFEAMSRGASRAVLVESHPAAIAQLRANQLKLKATQMTILAGDAHNLLASMKDQFDLIFLDPPYQLNILPSMLALCKERLAAGGLVYVEHAAALSNEAFPDWLSGWEIIRSGKAGAVHYALLTAAVVP
jgi:16S rRNA (guanine(966)-N(2))-methyltransferase RsmD